MVSNHWNNCVKRCIFVVVGDIIVAWAGDSKRMSIRWILRIWYNIMEIGCSLQLHQIMNTFSIAAILTLFINIILGTRDLHIPSLGYVNHKSKITTLSTRTKLESRIKTRLSCWQSNYKISFCDVSLRFIFIEHWSLIHVIARDDEFFFFHCINVQCHSLEFIRYAETVNGFNTIKIDSIFFDWTMTMDPIKNISILEKKWNRQHNFFIASFRIKWRSSVWSFYHIRVHSRWNGLIKVTHAYKCIHMLFMYTKYWTLMSFCLNFFFSVRPFVNFG